MKIILSAEHAQKQHELGGGALVHAWMFGRGSYSESHMTSGVGHLHAALRHAIRGPRAKLIHKVADCLSRVFMPQHEVRSIK